MLEIIANESPFTENKMYEFILIIFAYSKPGGHEINLEKSVKKSTFLWYKVQTLRFHPYGRED